LQENTRQHQDQERQDEIPRELREQGLGAKRKSYQNGSQDDEGLGFL
jgi:hypothetical protein